MERIINVRIEKLPEGACLATSDEVQGLVAQGRTITEEIAREVARRLLEVQAERDAGNRRHSPPMHSTIRSLSATDGGARRLSIL